MKSFKSYKDMSEYAEENIGKYSYEAVLMNGKKCILADTGLPIGELIRDKVIDILNGLYAAIGENPNNSTEIEDRILSFSADIENYIINHSKRELGIEIFCNYSDF